MAVRDFRDLACWQLAYALKSEVFAFTALLPASRDFKFCDQIRDASASAPRNIAEGFGRFTPKEFARFLSFARASIAETQNHLIDARDRGYIDEVTFTRLFNLAAAARRTTTRLIISKTDTIGLNRRTIAARGASLSQVEHHRRRWSTIATGRALSWMAAHYQRSRRTRSRSSARPRQRTTVPEEIVEIQAFSADLGGTGFEALAVGSRRITGCVTSGRRWHRRTPRFIHRSGVAHLGLRGPS